MKLHYSKILLFALPLNILLTSYQVNTHKKPYIAPHHTQTNRSLCACDTQSSDYDHDQQMKKVMNNFNRQTSQRFEQYQERMKGKRQKRKEERDKNIQEIIDKDKMEKNVTEKIEKSCLKCGCGLGGVAASIGLFGGLGTYGWKSAAVSEAAKAAGAKEGVQTLINELRQGFGIQKLVGDPLVTFITKDNYCNATVISEYITDYYQSLCETDATCGSNLMFSSYKNMKDVDGTQHFVQDAKKIVAEAVKKANDMTVQVTETQMATLEASELKKIAETSTYAYSAIGYSVLAILIIVLVMIIIYLVLRYRRK
ncbi:rifin, partial [Plasmodium reichenowi]